MLSSNRQMLKDHSGKLLVWGLILTGLGLIAISAATMTTVVTVVFIGCLLMLGGIILIIDAFSFWWKIWSGFFLLSLSGLAYLIMGLMLVNSPILASISITLLLGIFYLGIGLLRSLYNVITRLPGWGWGMVGGILSLILGILILSSWPQSGLFIIGLFIGIDFLVTGIGYIMVSLAAKA